MAQTRLIAQSELVLKEWAFRIRQHFLTQVEGETIKVEFEGTWKRFRRVKQLVDATAQEAETQNEDVDVKTIMTLTFETPIPADDESLIRLQTVLREREFGKIELIATQSEE